MEMKTLEQLLLLCAKCPHMIMLGAALELECPTRCASVIEILVAPHCGIEHVRRVLACVRCIQVRVNSGM